MPARLWWKFVFRPGHGIGEKVMGMEISSNSVSALPSVTEQIDQRRRANQMVTSDDVVGKFAELLKESPQQRPKETAAFSDKERREDEAKDRKYEKADQYKQEMAKDTSKIALGRTERRVDEREQQTEKVLDLAAKHVRDDVKVIDEVRDKNLKANMNWRTEVLVETKQHRIEEADALEAQDAKKSQMMRQTGSVAIQVDNEKGIEFRIAAQEQANEEMAKEPSSQGPRMNAEQFSVLMKQHSDRVQYLSDEGFISVAEDQEKAAVEKQAGEGMDKFMNDLNDIQKKAAQKSLDDGIRKSEKSGGVVIGRQLNFEV